MLDHPKLYGVAMEFNPSDYGKRNEGQFVTEVRAHGKSAFFLLPFLANAPGGKPAELTISEALQKFKRMGADVADPRVHVVLARYGQPHLAIAGSSNSIEAAFLKAQEVQAEMAEGHRDYNRPRRSSGAYVGHSGTTIRVS